MVRRACVPWSSFLTNSVVPLYRLIILGILVLLLRRLPFVLAIHKYIPQIEEVRQAIFVGFFSGPVGVSAIFLPLHHAGVRPDADLQGRAPIRREGSLRGHHRGGLVYLNLQHRVSPIRPLRMDVTNYSPLFPPMQVVHGLSIPLGKLGYYLPRTISRGLPSPTTEGGTISSFHIGARMSSTIPFRRTRTSGRSSLDTSAAP